MHKQLYTQKPVNFTENTLRRLCKMVLLNVEILFSCLLIQWAI